MEVDTVQGNDLVNGIEAHTDEQSLSPEGSDVYDAYVDQDIFPRVGEQYQVEIPPLMSQSDYCRLQKNINEAETTAASPHDFSVGLPILITWINDEVGKKRHTVLGNVCKSGGIADKLGFSKLKCNKKSQNSLYTNESNSKHEVIMGESANLNVQQETMVEAHENNKGKGFCLVPGSSTDIWNEKEEARLILSLYVFGKNLVLVKKLMGNKKMRDILSFYYGKFYKSEKYRRWSECRKMRSRKCIYGQKIFTGPRQQELLSRLLPNLSEECSKSLHEVSKTFTEGKMLLEDYVLTLKALVGLDALVEAVAIGKGKEDLTVFTTDSSKSTHTFPARPEIPVGKACSMLTPAEIITFLTGDFRLSKARSSDLFWEAVWPRLLARGWHSEQPGSHSYALPSKNSLVFLVPGVKRYTRKLVKGNHYFDSVSDVLVKVASDPELIELESVTDNNCKSVEGNGWTNETKLDRENSPEQQRHCYLKPRTPNRSLDVMKFTVVDTSLASEKMSKVREMRSLPVGILASASENDSDSEDTSEEHTNESECVNTVCCDWKNADVIKATKGNIGREVSTEINDFKNDPSSEELQVGAASLYVTSKDRNTDLFSSTHRKNSMKFQSSSRLVPDDKNVIAPVAKRRRRLSACSHAERTCNVANVFVAPRVKQEEAICCCDSSNSNKIVFPGESPPVEKKEIADPPPHEIKIFADPSLNASQIKSGEAVPESSSSCHDDQHEKPWKRMIDLNLPVPPEVEVDELCNSEMTGRQQNNTREDTDDSCAATISNPEVNSEQPNVNTRRQSTRNRPLTAKVLEAFALGYLDRKEKRRGRDYLLDSSASRPSRRVRGKKTGETSSSSGANFHKEEASNVVCNGNGDVILTGFKSNEG
ncbi:uncharacterized protein LOC129309956 [Prosopis cineraria]|uniref:uncharacterized protein LOC129309956 n=1 Tax=Prosopis cineraria TaxID=364024 RepID=UPI0024107032|nr:uncharacterized protein LOC129309956 [Prosopis cineraria]